MILCWLISVSYTHLDVYKRQVLIVLHITDIATDVGIMGMTMFTVANLVVIEAVAVWTKRRDSQMFQR